MKISDFSLAKIIIKKSCSVTGSNFMDLDIEFDYYKESNLGYYENKMWIGDPESVLDLNLNLVYYYFCNFKEINNKELFVTDKPEDVHSKINNYIKKNIAIKLEEDNFINRFSQNHLASTLAQDLICPFLNKQYVNYKVYNLSSPYLDISGVILKEEKIVRIDDDSLYLNNFYNFSPIKNAHLIHSYVKILGECPVKFAKDFRESALWSSFVGFSSLYYKNEDELEAFLNFFLSFSEYDLSAVNLKTAQLKSNNFGNFWILGLIENMLAPVRGEDHYPTEVLEKRRNETIKKIREKSKGPITIEHALRIIFDKEEKPEIIEKKISDGKYF